MEKLKKVSRAQWCLFALFIGFAFLMQNCQDDDALIYEENQTETELNARPVSGKVDVCRYNERKGTYSVVSLIAKFVPSKLLPGDVIIDADGDGYAAQNKCTMLNGLDCDDTDAAINPGAVEICGDDKDNNCDGVMDDGCTIEGKTFVPNDNFEKALISLTLDDVLDNYVLTANINTVTSLNLSGKEIGNLTGIEDFAALQILDCYNNSITRLDLSKNTKLVELFCQNNALTELIVSNSLVYIDCAGNSLTELDLSANVNLTDLVCYNNLLNSLNISSNADLKYLNCSYNPDIGILNVGSYYNLESLYCYNIGLTSLDLSGNPFLLNLSCDSNNQLSYINVSKNTALKFLTLDSCGLTSLDVTENIHLEDLYCNNNALGSLNVIKNAKLIYLSCTETGLETLNLSGNPNLKILYCDNNALKSLNISDKFFLTDLDCSENQLSSLDLSQNDALTVLDCSYNNPYLTCIKVSQYQLDNYNSWDWWKDADANYSLNCTPE